jgi:hypothetical protein
MFKNPTNHGLLGPSANELCAHLRKNIIKKNWEKIMTKNWKQIMVFWAHGLTNVQPISKSWTTNILFCGKISQPNF